MRSGKAIAYGKYSLERFMRRDARPWDGYTNARRRRFIRRGPDSGAPT